MKKNCLLDIFPTTGRFCCCTLRQGSNLCTWIILVHSIFGACFTTVLLISPDDVNVDYDVLYWDRPYYMYPLMFTFWLIYILQVLACIFYMMGDCQHRGAKLKWVRLSLYMSIPLFLMYVLTYVLWFVFLMYNDKTEAFWSVLGPFKFAFAYCSNMTMKSYFLGLLELYPPYWQDPEDPDNEGDKYNRIRKKRTKPEKRKGFKDPTPAEQVSTGPSRSKAQSMILADRTKAPSSPGKPRAQTNVPAVPGRVPSNPVVPATGRGRARGKAPSNPAILARDSTQSNPANTARGRSRGKGQSSQANEFRTRTESNPANTSRERTQSNPANRSRERTRSNPVNPVRSRAESNPANPVRDRTQSNPANPARGRGRGQPSKPDRERTASNTPNPNKK